MSVRMPGVLVGMIGYGTLFNVWGSGLCRSLADIFHGSKTISQNFSVKYTHNMMGIFFYMFYCISSDFSDLPDMTGEYTNSKPRLEH